ncbi:hypothetical protein NX059_011787 [Plenodomus lindquistii]|nr:hypothetical protein NX059_011787 [Plenodomus lindquistii]
MTSHRLRTWNATLPGHTLTSSEFESEQYISVDFKWLTPPVTIYLAITLFLFTTIFKSRNEEVPLWKSSSLVLLHTVEHNNGMQTLKQVEKGAKYTQVQLQYTEQSWHLQDVTETHT